MTKIKYNLFEKSKNYNLASQAVEGIVEQTKLSDTFFGQCNMDLLQTIIAHDVYQKTGKKISKQSENELLIIMRSYFLSEANNVVTSDNDIKNEIRRLDLIVKEECVKKIITMIKQQDAYIKEISNVHTPLDRSESTNVKGTKLREMHRFL